MVKPRPVPTAPRLWPGSTVVCIASGPSLTAEDVNYCRGRAHVIAVNDASRLAPWADVVYADLRWWHHYGGLPKYTGLRYAITDPYVIGVSTRGLVVLRNTGKEGLDLDPTSLRNGKNSGYQAINLAVHFGATRIVLLGYDLSLDPFGKRHFFGDHPDGLANTNEGRYQRWLEYYATLVTPLSEHGISIVNSSRRTRLRCFPCTPLEQALSVELEAAS